MFQRVTPVVLNLLILNGLMFVAINLLQPDDTLFVLNKPNPFGWHHTVNVDGLEVYGRNGSGAYFGPGDFRPWQLLTHFFAHQSIWHFLGNMLALFSLGTAVEAAMGSQRFLVFYLFCGLLAGFAIALVDPTVNPVLGASGAIAGVMVGLGFYFPKSTLILFPIPIPIQARWLAVGLFVFSLVMVIRKSQGNVSHFGHLAGMVAALLYFFGRQFLPPSLSKWR